MPVVARSSFCNGKWSEGQKKSYSVRVFGKQPLTMGKMNEEKRQSHFAVGGDGARQLSEKKYAKDGVEQVLTGKRLKYS